MAIKVVSWNIEGRLTRFAKTGHRGSPEHITGTIRKLDADVVFLAEATDGDAVEPEVSRRLGEMGYEIFTVHYDDGDKDRQWAAEQDPNMKLLSRVKVVKFEQVRLGGLRNALIAVVADPETKKHVSVFGVHLDDRDESYRIRQVKDILARVQASSLPTIVTGDFNAMHGDDIRAKLLRLRIVSILVNLWPFARSKDVANRLIGMAAGDAISILESESGLKDIDIRRQATTTPKMRFQEWLPSVRIVQIDHMFVTPDVVVNNFKVNHDGGSDHRAISATLKIS